MKISQSIQKISHTHLCFAKLLCFAKIPCENPCEIRKGVRTHFATMRSPKARAKTNSHLKLYLKSSKPCFHFACPICSLRNRPLPCDVQASIDFLSIGHPAANHLKRRPTPLTPFLTWHALEEAIPSLHYLASRGQEPHLLRIQHLRPPRPRPFHLLRVECPLILLSVDIRRGDHRLLHPLNH